LLLQPLSDSARAMPTRTVVTAVPASDTFVYTATTRSGRRKEKKLAEEAAAAAPAASPAVQAAAIETKASKTLVDQEKKRKHVEDAGDAALPSTDAKQKKQKSAPIETVADIAQVSVVTDKENWAARKLAKKQRKQERAANLDEETNEALQAKLGEKAAREAANKKLKSKGKLTKKEKYKAAKAAKKAEATRTNDLPRVPFNLKEALAAANLEKLDPKAVSCFLTGLPYLATEKHIRDHFAVIGHANIQLLGVSAGKSDGTGFITFLSAEMALQACALTGSKIQGRWIKVRLCEPRETGAGVNKGPVEKPEGCLSVVVKCDTSISEASLKRFFVDCNVANVSRMMDKLTGEFRGTAFMDFEDTAMVDEAVKKSGLTIKGLPILVRYKMEKKADTDASRTVSSRTVSEVKIETTKKVEDGRVAAHNRAPPVPAPTGKMITFHESDSE